MARDCEKGMNDSDDEGDDEGEGDEDEEEAGGWLPRFSRRMRMASMATLFCSSQSSSDLR